MIYVEYVQRDRHMPIEIFRAFGDQAAWDDPNDRLVLNIGRTLRLGPHPAYMAFWKCAHVMRRLDEWEEHFRSDHALKDAGENATHKTIWLSDAGCFDEVVEGPMADAKGLQYVEFFQAPAEVANEAVAAHFKARAGKHPKGVLNHVVRRIGLLAPSAMGDMAVWTFPDYVALEAILREEHAEGPLTPTMAGAYRRFGREIL